MRRLILAAALLVAGCGGQTITGTFVLRDSAVDWSTTSCSGTGGYSDIREGVDVVVKDAGGTIIGTGDLINDQAGSSASRCSYTFEAPVPASDFYAVEVGRRGALTFSHDEMVTRGWVVSITLGG